MFVTFEGGEGAGKTTLIDGLVRALEAKGRSVLKTREPGGTPLGEAVRSLLLHKADMGVCPHAELMLFLASRAQHVADVIAPALRAGRVVLCDRFNDSSIAYQGAARGLGAEKVAAACAFASQGVEPQLTLYLDIAPEVGLQRAKRQRAQDRIEAEALEFHAKIREGYLALANQHPERIRVLDAAKPPEAVLAAALRELARYV